MKWSNFDKVTGKKAAAFLLLLGLLSTSCTRNSGDRDVANDTDAGPKTAFQIYSELQEAATSFNTKAIMVNGDLAIDGLAGGVTWGAEKEASSALITRVMTPDSDTFKSVVNNIPEAERTEFLREFLGGYVKNANGHRTYKTEEGVLVDLSRDVVDLEGNAKLIDIEQLKGIDYATASLEEMTEKFNKFVDMTDGRPMSFIKPATRSKMFKGSFAGMSADAAFDGRKNYSASYGNWVAIFGDAEKYVDNAHGHGGGTGGGWEINFKPQGTYGEFEESVLWFKKSLKNAGRMFQAPGHQRMVFRNHPDLKIEKLGEVYKAIQALIVVDGIKGNTGIEKANYKSVTSDERLATLSTGRGVIRLEGSKWATDTRAVEFRAGTKDLKTARFYHTVLASRVATNDWDGIADTASWTLYDGNSPNASDLASKFGVEEAKAQKAMDALSAANVKSSYQIPFWNWIDENNPFLSNPKRSLVKSLTADLILALAELPDNAGEGPARSLLRSWTKSTRLSEELREYLKPKRGFELTADLLHFNAPSNRTLVPNVVDVNNIDLGIEYSGKLPLKLDAEFSDVKLADNKKAWLQTRVDLTAAERENLLKKVASDLMEELGATGEVVRTENPGGHGHGLEVSWEIRDTQNRKWIVEWDGVGRSYDPAGNVIEGSARAGSIELVTPKFTPTVDEMGAVFKAFKKSSIMPSLLTGGGHINVDLAAFEGKPKQLARFMSIFHEHRGTIALMFQNINRLKSGEPIEVSAALSSKLKNFQGTEDELKKLLYEERYFNTRYGRKTRYNQLEMSAFFQDVIPESFMTDDFDIASPTEQWRRQFRADPNIRKAEFRLFNAPRDAAESALQIRLVKAMLSKALNEDGELSGNVQKVSHEDYLKNTDKAYGDLEKLCDDLGLNINDYRPAVAEGLAETDLATRSIFYESLDTKLQMHPKQTAWGDAVAPRVEAINSEGRAWTAGAEDAQNTMTNAARLQAAEEGVRRRANIVPDRVIPGDFRRTDSCIDAMAPFI